jgi:hypothetical protein
VKARLSVIERSLLAVGSFFFEKQNGYRVPFSGELLRTLGFARMMEFAKLSEPIMEEAVRVFGERDSQALCGMSALFNGCPYCSVGHLLAANLLHLREKDALFPLDEQDVPALRRMRDADIVTQVRQRLSATEPRLLARIERALALRDETRVAEGEEDAALRALGGLWSIITECSVQFEVPASTIPPLDKIAKDKALRARYAALRSEAKRPA